MAPLINRRDLLKVGAAGTGALAAAGVGRTGRPAALAQTPGPAGAGTPTPTANLRVPPDDPRYPTLVRGFNLRWVGQPAYVVLCVDTADVVREVQQAVDAGRRITVRGGGHCYEDFVSGNDGGVIIDLSLMNEVWRDPSTGWYGVEGGATLWDVYRRLYAEYGVALPGGSCYSVGVGGHVAGGGYGLLSRLHGLTVDFLHAVEVVHVTQAGRAEAITVSRDATDPAERDLLWGHLGGGGNFGIVTKYFFRDLPPAPGEAQLLTLAWNWSGIDRAAFGRLIHNYGQFLAANSGVDSPYKGLFSLLHLSQRVAEQIVLTVQYVGPEPERLKEFASAVGNGLPGAVPKRRPVGYQRPIVHDTNIQTLPWLDATQSVDGSGPNRRGKYKSAYMLTAFPEDQIETMWQHLTNPSHPNPLALLQVDSYGCQVNAVDPAATAVPQRSSIMKLQYQTYWTDPADDGANLDWIRGFYTAMYGARGPLPDATVHGCYVNYPDVDLQDWATLYYKGNYPRLQAVKARWDPHNIFNYSQSIRPPAPQGARATPTR